MGLFSWLFGRREPERVAVRDLLWMDAASRSRAVAKELADHITAGRSVLLLAHFPSTLAALAPDLLGENLPREPISDDFTPQAALRSAPPRVLFGLVRNLRPDEFPATDAPESPLPVLLVERHLVRRHDERVTEFAKGLGGRATIAVHVSLDDDLIKMFGADRIRNLLKTLGMRDDEALDSGMANRRVRAAQSVIASSVRADDVPADSPAEWMKLNQKL